MVRGELAAVTKTYEVTTTAVTRFRLIVPPRQCKEGHLIATEALQLMEQGLSEMKGFMELALRTGRPDHDRRERANRLLAEADRVKQRGLFQSETCK